MAIAFDSFTAYAETGGTSQVVSHTTSGSDRHLIVGINLATSNDNVTGVTYNGVSMTQVGTTSRQAGTRTYMYSLQNPASGTNNVVVSLTFSTIRTCAASYTGVSGGESGQTVNNSAASSASISTTSTSTDAGDWAVAVARNLDGTPANGTNFVQRTASSLVYADSNATVGSGSITVTMNAGSGNQRMEMVTYLLIPAGAAVAPKPTLMMLGVGS